MDDPRHQTFQAFGWPKTLIRDYNNWSVLIRPKQATLGAMVLVAKSDTTAFSNLPPEAFAEMHHAVSDIETAAKQAFGYQKINYLMLMMVDPQVHFHVLPRYDRPQSFAEQEFADAGWPGPPDLGAGPTDAVVVDAVKAALLAAWPT